MNHSATLLHVHYIQRGTFLYCLVCAKRCVQIRCYSCALPEPPSLTTTKDCTFGSLAHVCNYTPGLEAEWFCGLKTRYDLVTHPRKNANETHEIEFLREKRNAQEFWLENLQRRAHIENRGRAEMYLKY
jgi:hypothetical protein